MPSTTTDLKTLGDAAWRTVEQAIVAHRGQPVGTIAARDPTTDPVNYDHVFARDFFVSTLACLKRGRADVVRGFLDCLVDLQAGERHRDCFRPTYGLMPASFVVENDGDDEAIDPDFGEHAIGRVTPVDSGMWWLLTLRAYVHATGDEDYARSPVVQRAIRLIVDLHLTEPVEMLPTLLVPDGAYMIDRRMDVHGHPMDLQALFVAALRAARTLTDDDQLRRAVDKRLGHLTYHVRHYYWLDLDRLSALNRFKVEEFGESTTNPFNIHPQSIPAWLSSWMPDEGGYFVGNLGPGRIDFRWFALGNLLAVVSSLATEEQSAEIFRLIEARWEDLIGGMPMKLSFPALEGKDWMLLTGADQKNVPWSYHNGGSWPMLLWLFTAAAVRAGRSDLAERAVRTAARHVEHDSWPEYYDGPQGRLVGRQARLCQTWTAAAVVVAVDLLEDPDTTLPLVTFDDKLPEEPSETEAGDSAR